MQNAPINGNGTVGAWTTTTSFTTARMAHTSVAYNGYLYVIAGTPDGTSYFCDVQYAPINGNGTVGTWTATNSCSVFENAFTASPISSTFIFAMYESWYS